MGMLDFLHPQKMVEDATTSVAEAGGNFLTNMVTAPFRAVGNVFSSVTGAIAGFGRGVFSGIGRMVKFSAIALGVQAIAPNLVNDAYGAILGPEALRKRKEGIEKNGLPGLVLTSAEMGIGAGALLGGISGAFEGAGEGIFAKGTAAVVMATVGAVTIGALHHSDIALASNNGPATVPPTPQGAKPKAEQAKG